MPNIRPLKRIAGKVRDLRERHRPTGFGFAPADRIDYLDAANDEAPERNPFK